MELIGYLKFGYLTIFDHACLHRTFKNGEGLRVSVDFGIVTKNSSGCRDDFVSNSVKNVGKKISYKDSRDVIRIGKDIFVEATETLQECYNKFRHDKYNEKPTSHISDNLKIGS